MRRSLLALLAAGLLCCKADATQLLVVVRSDLPPEDIRVVRVTVTDLDDAQIMLRRDFDVGRDVNLPFSFGVTPPNGRRRHRVEILAEALPNAASDTVVTRRAWVGFVPHETLLLTLYLGEDCRHVVCSPDRTCDRGRCIDPNVDETSLPPVRPGEELSDAALTDAAVNDADAATDGGAADVALDAAAPPPDTPTLRFPWNGYATGSARVAAHLQPTLRWERVPRATHYELAATSDCERSSFRSCDLDGAPTVRVEASPDPLVAASLPLAPGFVVWSVRACDESGGCSPFAEPRYLLAGVDRTDLTGDGYGDIVVGAPDAYMRDGAVILFAGPSFDRTPLPVYGSGTGSGGALAFVGDVDGDGVIDLGVVGLQSAGRFELFAGGSSPARLYQMRLPAPHARRPSIAGCDLDGDGYSDAILGFSGTLTGEVRIFPGAPTPTPTSLPPLTPPPSDEAAAFGAALACVGDVDGDGLSDLLVSAPDIVPGHAYLIYGDASRAFDRRLRLGPDRATFDFGRKVTGLGDVDGDGLADFAIAARGADRSFVLVYAGSDPSGEPLARLLATSPTWDLGASMAGGGDVDGNGTPDLVVGAPYNGAPGTAGGAFVYLGPSFEPTPVLTFTLADTAGTFGWAVAVGGDVDADGLDDFTVGCLSCEGYAGRAVYYGNGRSEADLEEPDWVFAEMLGENATFGAALATASP